MQKILILFACFKKKSYLCGVNQSNASTHAHNAHWRTQRKQSKQQKNMYTNREKIEWTLIFVYEFGRRYGLTTKQAFNYLKRYKGIDFVDRHYDYVHTQSFESMINDISEYCRLKGGMLQ